ncbi:hypothetical protein ASG89_28965 [Paenibacillus sp. Soil766]|uniref:flagellar protein FliT n=1 Tax=Paenibacillus sp. Soil766 TaxID=1736404 RepID=UPI0007091C22|nr:flagellar protein FliT [Paenibacillus sp. Soil766]KRE97938.1 hypothetical protein ASG89_28965 [Paenibacillus sp. Soil766]
MDELIRQLEECTQHFLSEMEEADYLVVEQFVEQRDEIIAKIKDAERTTPLLEKHKVVVNRLLQHDPAIVRKITFLRNEASLKIKSFQQATTQRNAYESNPSDMYTQESYFFDKKK